MIDMGNDTKVSNVGLLHRLLDWFNPTKYDSFYATYNRLCLFYAQHAAKDKIRRQAYRHNQRKWWQQCEQAFAKCGQIENLNHNIGYHKHQTCGRDHAQNAIKEMRSKHVFDTPLHNRE